MVRLPDFHPKRDTVRSPASSPETACQDPHADTGANGIYATVISLRQFLRIPDVDAPKIWITSSAISGTSTLKSSISMEGLFVIEPTEVAVIGSISTSMARIDRQREKLREV